MHLDVGKVIRYFWKGVVLFMMFTLTRGRWSKKSTFCKLLYRRKCKQRGVGGQKKTNLVNVVCERPLMV